jgi:hypothetical protein
MRKGYLPALTAAAALCACATTPNISDLIGRNTEPLVTATRAQGWEASEPQKAREAYELILKTTGVPDQPPAFFQQELDDELKTMGDAGSPYDLQKDGAENAALSFPPVYDRRIEAIARARLGLARLALARSDWRGVETQAKTAVELVNQKAQSPLFMAHQTLACYELLRQAYSRQGKIGRERLAKLNGDLLREYLHSKQGRADFFAARQAETGHADSLKKMDEFVSQLEQKQQLDQQAALMSLVGAVAHVGANMQQTQINNAMASSGGRMTPQIQQMQNNKMLMDYQSKLLSQNVDFKNGGGLAAGFLSPLSSLAAGQQLLNPDFGLKAPQLIKGFATGIAALSGRDEVKQSAQSVLASVDGIVEARGGDSKEIGQALAAFAEAFSSLQSETEELQKPAAER